jgi:hypothetical protein
MKKVWWRHGHDGRGASQPQAGRQQRTRHPFRDDVILVTITY